MRTRLITYSKLGIKNVWSVLLYRLLKKCGYYRYKLPILPCLTGPFFSEEPAEPGDNIDVYYFTAHKLTLDSPPDWFLNPWNNKRFGDPFKHWSEVPDFIPSLGDIKTVWELSRFDWLPRMAWRYKTGEKQFLGIIELWLRDWCKKNPPNQGINWKCGQEAGLRCLNIIAASLCIDDRFFNPLPGFLEFLKIHLERIIPTLHYAIAQNNNHGISEAAALFAGGCYLAKYANNKKYQIKGRNWYDLGRYWLEDRVRKLILDDGSFSQYSITYHRMVLDELAFIELFRRKMDLSPLSKNFYQKAEKAVEWYHALLDDFSGDAPNLGANDGTYLFNITNEPYRNFLSSLQLSSSVFSKKEIKFSKLKKTKHPLLKIFQVTDKEKKSFSRTFGAALMPKGGYACIRHNSGFAMLRLPVYRFRPSHADALHLDIWHNGINWSRDAGTYSYNTYEELLNYFPGTSAHSTIEFDDRDQMPRLSRFLFGAWLKPYSIDCRNNFLSSSYIDYCGAYHKRTVKWKSGRWIIVDEISGFTKKAVLRWHLPDKKWLLRENRAECKDAILEVKKNNAVTNIALVWMPESRFYMKKTQMPVLEVQISEASEILTIFSFKTDKS